MSTRIGAGLAGDEDRDIGTIGRLLTSDLTPAMRSSMEYPGQPPVAASAR